MNCATINIPNLFNTTANIKMILTRQYFVENYSRHLGCKNYIGNAGQSPDCLVVTWITRLTVGGGAAAASPSESVDGQSNTYKCNVRVKKIVSGC